MIRPSRSHAAVATASMPTARHRPPIADGSDIAVFIFFLATLLVTPQCAAQPAPPSKANFVQTKAANFSPTMSTVIVILISALFFLAFFSVYIRQCAGEAVAIAAADQLAGVQSGLHRAAMGLKPEILESFPTIAYAEAKTLKVGHGDLECAVCLSEFDDEEALRLLPGCCHVFHPDCISAWLASHITCPVCRSDLSAVSFEQPTVPLVASQASDAGDTPTDLVVVVIADRRPTEEEAMELTQIGTERREERSRRGRRPSKLPRSHSTGHSLAQSSASEDVDRYTLRLPPHIQRELFAARKFHRSTSCVSFPVGGDGSSRPGYRAGGGAVGEGSSRGRWNWRQSMSDRWPSFLIRTFSARMPGWKRGDGEGSVKKGDSEDSSKGKLGGVRTPFDCLGGGGSAGSVKADLSGDDRVLPQ